MTGILAGAYYDTPSFFVLNRVFEAIGFGGTGKKRGRESFRCIGISSSRTEIHKIGGFFADRWGGTAIEFCGGLGFQSDGSHLRRGVGGGPVWIGGRGLFFSSFGLLGGFLFSIFIARVFPKSDPLVRFRNRRVGHSDGWNVMSLFSIRGSTCGIHERPKFLGRLGNLGVVGAVKQMAETVAGLGLAANVKK